MKRAIEGWLAAAARGADAVGCATAAAEAVAAQPWDVVHLAGRLARCKVAVADRDLGLTVQLAEVEVDARHAVVRVAAGQPYPRPDQPGRRSRGAFDTPVDLARAVVKSALAAASGPKEVGLDPACGTGAFLVAMLEAGVREVYGTDLDPAALAVAQVAAPGARVVVEDALKWGPSVDLVCGNPPYVPPERQDRELRAELRRRFPWLRGRFDLVIPFAATAAERVRPGGGLGLVLPAPALVQPYGAPLRRRWIERHRIHELAGPEPFPGASVDVVRVVLQVGAGPAPLPRHGITAQELLRLANAPLNPELAPGDVDLVERIRAASVPLGTLALVDTGLVAHGADGGKRRLIHDEPGEGRVPYADAREFFAGQRRWLDYQPRRMHRAKTRERFEQPKLVIQRLRGKGPVRAAVDREGVYLGHTCTIVQLRGSDLPLDRLLELVRSPLVDGLTRVEAGQRLDLYPRDVAAFPVPKAWLTDPGRSLASAWSLGSAEVARLEALAAR